MFWGPPTRRREVPIRRLVPNLLTTIALSSGLASLHFSLQQDWDRALGAIFVAAVFDALDGRAARLLRVTSRFGAVLDSISDFLAFGIAPALLLHQWMGADLDVFGIGAVMTYVLCAAFRLARFTASASKGRANPLMAKFFVGMPSPAAAGAVLIPPLLHASPTVNFALPAWAVTLYTFFIAWLMVSRQPMFSFKRIRIRRHLVIPLLIVVGLLVMTATKDAWLIASILAFAYVCTLPASILAHRRLRAAAAAAGPAESSGEPFQTQGIRAAPAPQPAADPHPAQARRDPDRRL